MEDRYHALVMGEETIAEIPFEISLKRFSSSDMLRCWIRDVSRSDDDQ